MIRTLRSAAGGLLAASFLCLLLALGCRDAPPPPAPDSGRASLTVGRVPAGDGAPIAYSSRGHGEVALVFVHGWMGDQTYWRHQVAAFEDRYRVVTIDLPGHGKSDAGRLTWTLEAYGGDVAAVALHLELERVVLVGHSMGGAVILDAATRLGDRVAGVIGVETLHDAEFEVPEEQWRGLMAAYREDFAGTCGQMVAAMFPDPESPLAAEVEADMCAGPADVGIALMERFGAYRGAETMAEVDAPIRAINAEFSSPTRVEVNRRYAPGFDAIIQPGVGHFPMLEAPERFNQLFAETLEAIGV